MGKYSNNKFQIEDSTKDRVVNTWKRVQIFDKKNCRCFADNDKSTYAVSIIDFRIDERNETILFKNVSGVNVREYVLVQVLLGDKDIKKYITKNWEHFSKFSYHMEYREGMSGHQYNVATRWTDEYQGHRYQHVTRDIFKWETNSSGKLDYQTSPHYIPIWVLIGYDLAFHREYVNDLVARNHAAMEELTEEEQKNYEFETAVPYRLRFKKRTKNSIKNALRKEEGVRVKYTPGYRISCLAYEEQKKADSLLYMCD